MDAGSEIALSDILSGNIRIIARLISLVERNDPSRVEIIKKLHQYTGKAHIIGITGPPGAGKSTVTDKLIKEFLANGKKVAVIAVDPSSPFTGGAILGDRIRMMNHATDPRVFIRSLASRGHLGGLSRACGETMRILDGAGFDTIIIETVGVGQSEVEIVRYADTVILLTVPGLGDDIQAIKAGIMEIGDVFCVNKADKDGVERTMREIKSMLETAILNNAPTRFTALYSEYFKNRTQDVAQISMDGGHHGIAEMPGHEMMIPCPPVLSTIAETGEGIQELANACTKHFGMLNETGFLALRRKENLLWELQNMVTDAVQAKFSSDIFIAKAEVLVRSVSERHMDVYEAGTKLFQALLDTYTQSEELC